MKRIVLMALVLCLALGAWAEGAKETDMTISLAGVGVVALVGGDVFDGLRETYPFVTFEGHEADIATGEDVTMAALIASGQVPDLYTDFAGRAGKYVTKSFALPLVVDESQWVAAQLEPYRRGGVLLALPQAAQGQAMVLNMTFLDRIGYELPAGIDDGWTIAEFLAMCEAVKRSGVPDVYATGLFAANPSADYLWVNWFASFGGEFFADDYTRTLANSPEFLEAWRFFALLRDRGYIHPNAAMWSVSPDFLQAIGKGTMVAYGSRMGWPTGMQANFNKDGAKYEWKAVSFPSVDGKPVPVATGPHIVVGHKSNDPLRAAIITELVELIAKLNQQAGVDYGAIPSLVGFAPSGPLPQGEDVVHRIAGIAGLLDVGMPNSWYMETRSAGPEVLMKLLKGEITPEQAHREYYEKIAKIIGQ